MALSDDLRQRVVEVVVLGGLRLRGLAAPPYIALCPHCGASVPTALTANATTSRALAYLAPERNPSDRRRARTVHQRVRVLLAARD